MINRIFLFIMKYALGVHELEKVYFAIKDEIVKYDLWSAAVKQLNLPIKVHPDELNHIPTKGPVVIVSNHPFGGADGIVLSYLVQQKRDDLKVFVTNMLTEKIPEARKHFLDVELYSKAHGDLNKNKSSVQAAIDHVKNGGSLIVFPAGTPAQAKTLFGKAVDLDWRSGAAKIIHGSKATVVPAYFEGQNSRFFQIVGLIFKKFKAMRTLLLGRELLKRRNKITHVRIGSNINYSALEGLGTKETLALLRSRVYLLSEKNLDLPKKLVLKNLKKNLIPHKLRKSSKIHEVIDPIPTNKIVTFLENYKREQPESLIMESNRYQVMIINGTKASEDFLLELGRLREIAFRAAGEGTGKRCDLDEHDPTYHHLIVWNEKKQWISGAYRLGLSPYVLKSRGLNGFYTQPFFNIQKNFFDKAGDCVELGRSFVRKEEQSQWILFYLWKGIAKFLFLNPNYNYLFGSVSISQDYSDRSRQLISKYFLKHHGDTEGFSKLISAEIPYDYKSDLDPKDVENVLKTLDNTTKLSQVISDLEEDLKRVPVLVYRYAELGAQYLTFTVDPDFGNTLDGFIVLKVKEMPAEQMKKYLTEEEVISLLKA